MNTPYPTPMTSDPFNINGRLTQERTRLDDRRTENLDERKQLLLELKKDLTNYEAAPGELESGQRLLQALLHSIQLFKLAIGDLQKEEETQRERLFMNLTQYQSVLSQIAPDLERNKGRLQLVLNQNFPNVSYDSPDQLFVALLHEAHSAGKAVHQTVQKQVQIVDELNGECSKQRIEIMRTRERVQRALSEIDAWITDTSWLDQVREQILGVPKGAAPPDDERKVSHYEGFVNMRESLRTYLGVEIKIRKELVTLNQRTDSTTRPELSDADPSDKLRRYIETKQVLDEDIETSERREQDNLDRIVRGLISLGKQLDEKKFPELAQTIYEHNRQLTVQFHARNAAEILLNAAEKLLADEVELWSINGPKIREHTKILHTLYPKLASSISKDKIDRVHLNVLKIYLDQLASDISFKNPTSALASLRQCYEAAHRIREAIAETMQPGFKDELNKIEMVSFLRSLRNSVLPSS